MVEFDPGTGNGFNGGFEDNLALDWVVWWGTRWGGGVLRIYISYLGIQYLINVLLVLTVLFLFLDFPGLSEALGIGDRSHGLVFKETAKFFGASGEAGVSVVGGFKLNRQGKLMG